MVLHGNGRLVRAKSLPLQKDMCDPSGTLKKGQLVYTPDVGALHTVDKDCYAEINSDGASSPQVCVGVTIAQS